MTQVFVKAPTAKLDYKIDWTDWLGLDTISTSTWTLPTGITKVSDTKTTTVCTIWLSGGTVDVDYILTNKIVTAAGREDTRTLRIEVRDR